MTLQNPRCVFQLMKAHFAPYTPEMVEKITGTPQDKFQTVCEWAASTGNGERSMTIMYALGWTQHSSGSQNIRSAAMIQLLLGNIGVPGGGINALRGHSNVQGITDIGTLTASLPGYMAMPTDSEPTLEVASREADLHAAAGEPDQLLAELPQVLRELPEEPLRRRRRRRRTSSATPGCRSSTPATTP